MLGEWVNLTGRRVFLLYEVEDTGIMMVANHNWTDMAKVETTPVMTIEEVSDFFTLNLIAFGCVWKSQHKENIMARKEKATICISCGVNLIERGYVRFPCPQCGVELGRCAACRHQSNSYKCPGCGFEGP